MHQSNIDGVDTAPSVVVNTVNRHSVLDVSRQRDVDTQVYAASGPEPHYQAPRSDRVVAQHCRSRTLIGVQL